jgi:hypothetical protein
VNALNITSFQKSLYFSGKITQATGMGRALFFFCSTDH